MGKLKELWGKFGWILCLIFVGVSIFALLKPAKVTEKATLITEENWKKSVVQTIETMKKEYYGSLTQMQTELKKSQDVAKNINTKNTKTYDPQTGKLVSDVTEKIDLSKIASNMTSTSTITITVGGGSVATSTSTTTVTAEGGIKIIEKTVKVTENVGFLSVEGGYLHVPSADIIHLYPGWNIDASTTIMGGPAYDIKNNGLGYGINFRTSIK